MFGEMFHQSEMGTPHSSAITVVVSFPAGDSGIRKKCSVSGGAERKGIMIGDTVTSAGDGELTATDESRVIGQQDERVLLERVGLNGREGSRRNGLK